MKVAQDREEDMELQRRSVTATFDEVLRTRDLESRRMNEELRSELR